MPASRETALKASSTSSSMIVASARRSSGVRQDESRCLAPANSLTGTTAQTPLTREAPAAFQRGSASAASRTTRARASRSARLVISVCASVTLGATMLGLLRVSDVHHIAIEQIAVALRHRGGARLHAQFRHHFRRRTLHRAPADDGGNRDDRRRAGGERLRARRARARIGSTLMNGLDGQMTTARKRSSASAARRSGCGRASAAPSNASSRTTGRHCGGRNSPGNRANPSSVRTLVRTRSSVIGSTRGPTPSRRQKSAVTADRVSPRRSRRVRSTCTARSRSPRRNQFSPPSARQRFHERPGLVVAAPAELRVVEAGKRVHQRVDVRRDRQAEMLEIVAGIGDDEQIVRRQRCG